MNGTFPLIICCAPPRPTPMLATALANAVNDAGDDLHVAILSGSSLECIAQPNLLPFSCSLLQLQPKCTCAVRSSTTSAGALELSLLKLAAYLERVFRLERIRQHLVYATTYAVAHEEHHKYHDDAAHNQQGELQRSRSLRRQ